MAAHITFDHKNVPHTTIALPKDRSEAIARVTAQLGISQHAFIQRAITMALAVFGESV